jgi:hypothetical protein
MNYVTSFRSALALATVLCLSTGPLLAAEITAKMQTRIDTYKKQAATWATDPVVVTAVKDANAKGPIEGMGNAKWKELKETDPVVTAFVANAAGKQLTKWLDADAKGINKIVLTGAKSQRVAFTSMPAAYLGKGRPNFDTSMNDEKVWQQDESRPDPSTNIDSVQISAPVKDGDKVIGVLLVSLTADALKK